MAQMKEEAQLLASVEDGDSEQPDPARAREPVGVKRLARAAALLSMGVAAAVLGREWAGAGELDDTCRGVCPGRVVGGPDAPAVGTGPQSGHLHVAGLWTWSRWPWIAPSSAGNSLTIIHFNDCYQIGPINSGGQRRGGLQYIAKIIKDARAQNPDRTLVLFPGDAISPSALSDMNDGKQMIDILNMLTIDAASPGNHEFDFGVDVLQERVKESNFPWLVSNLLNVTTDKPIAGNTYRVIKDMPFSTGSASGTTRVCMFGVSYDVRESIHRDQEYIKHTPAIPAAKKEVKFLREEKKCNVVIALTHQFAGDDCEFSRALDKGVDVIIGAHDHTTQLETTCGHAPYIKTDSDAKTVWTTTLRLGSDGVPIDMVAKVEPVITSMQADAEVARAIAKWDHKAEVELGVPVGCTALPLDARSASIRHKETGLGSFVADAVRYISPHHTHPIDAAIVNSGGIRGNRLYPKGDLSMKEVVALHPFGNTIIEIWITGAQLHAFIEHSLRCYKDLCGDFPQVSNLKYSFSPTAPVGKRLKSLTFANGTVVTPMMHLSLAIPDFTRGHSPTLKDAPLYIMEKENDGLPLVYYIRDHIKLHKSKGKCISPKPDGRIKVLS